MRARLIARAQRLGISISLDTASQLERYVQLLARWNRHVNLTALELEPPTDGAIDRLLMEPLVAAAHLHSGEVWYDLGSGGGSPAIPIKIAQPRARLTMVESRERKAAFLREAVRSLGLADTLVENRRFEDVAFEHPPNRADLITARAVRADDQLFVAVDRLLSWSGVVCLFHSPNAAPTFPSSFELHTSADLIAGHSRLAVLRRRPGSANV
jgi:16S rRNA (guanine527-N7)-methyltransferase